MHRAQRIPTLPLFLGIALIAGQALAADFTGRVVGEVLQPSETGPARGTEQGFGRGETSLCVIVGARPVRVRSRLPPWWCHTLRVCRMSLHGTKIGKIRKKLEGRPCPFCGNLRYYVIVRYEASKEYGGLMVLCKKCGKLRGVVMETQSFWVKPRSLGSEHIKVIPSS